MSAMGGKRTALSPIKLQGSLSEGEPVQVPDNGILERLQLLR